MAKQTSILNFTGKLGNLIGYRRNGTYCIRSAPETVRQTSATRQAARNFGVASRKGKLIRRGIAPLLSIIHDGGMVNRLNKALIHTGKDRLSNIEGFRFNHYAGVEKFFAQPPIVSPDGTVYIPAQTLLPQGTATQLEITVISVRIHFIERCITRSNTTTLIVDLNKPFNGATFTTNSQGKGTGFVVLQVRCLKEGIPSEDRRFKAADILAVITPKKQKPAKTNTAPHLKKISIYQPLKYKSNNPVYPVKAWQRE